MNTALKCPEISPRKAAKAAAILDAAERVLIRHGSGFEISELANEAGVSNGLAYHYFGSKDGVIEAVISRFYARYGEVVDQPANPDIAWPVRERARLEEVVAFLYSDPLAPIVFGTLGHSSASAREFETESNLIAKAARNVASGQKRGEVPAEIDPALAGAAIIGAVHQTAMTAMQMDPRPAPKQVADQLWRLIAAAVGLRG
jgi:AcrR family transcriptional regulator